MHFLKQLLNSIINNVEIREIDKTFPKCLSPLWSAWLQSTRTCGTGQFKVIHTAPGSTAESNIHDFQRLQVSQPSLVHICFSDGFIFNSYLIQQLLRVALKHAQRPGFSFLSLRFGLHSFLLLNISEKNLSTSKREISSVLAWNSHGFCTVLSGHFLLGEGWGDRPQGIQLCQCSPANGPRWYGWQRLRSQWGTVQAMLGNHSLALTSFLGPCSSALTILLWLCCQELLIIWLQCKVLVMSPPGILPPPWLL